MTSNAFNYESTDLFFPSLTTLTIPELPSKETSREGRKRPSRVASSEELKQFQNDSVIKLHVVKMISLAKREMRTDTKKLEHFTMELDCSKCLPGLDDSSLRKFKRKAYSKLKMGENFKIYNS